MDVETSAFLKNTLSVDHQQMLGVSLGERKRSLTHSASSSGTSFRQTSGSEHGDLDDLQLVAERLYRLSEEVVRGISVPERGLARDALHDWGADMISLDERTNGHALLVYGLEVFRHHDLLRTCHIEEKALAGFLVAMEEGYGRNPYHNSIHAADVLMSTHLFLTTFGLIERLTPAELLAALLAAILHDFNHPCAPPSPPAHPNLLPLLSNRLLTRHPSCAGGRPTRTR